MNQHRQDNRNSQMQLYDRQKRRLYLNASERQLFYEVACHTSSDVRTFCLVLYYTGCRISEALELTPASVQINARLITFRTLKRRRQHVMREVPIPAAFARELDRVHTISAMPGSTRSLWVHGGQPLKRSLGYRWIKMVMAHAGIEGKQATPKGLRHGYGIHAIRSGVQLNMLSKWMGHARLSTTAIYADAMGKEELEIADRMW